MTPGSAACEESTYTLLFLEVLFGLRREVDTKAVALEIISSYEQ